MRVADFNSQFGPFERIWLNCAHQGPLPRVAVEAVHEAVRQKMTPSLIRDDDFITVPRQLKASLARLIGAAPADIILGNSASYGLHIFRNGMRWKRGDRILVAHGDFPATIYPWLDLQEQGVAVRSVVPRGSSLQAEELAEAITPSTRLLAISWVNSFNGSALDLQTIGDLCRRSNIIFLLNGSQAIGAVPLDVKRVPVDAVACCGYKWLCGPYGTGFCWIRPDLRNELTPDHTYWLPHVWGRENLTEYQVQSNLGAEPFDVFCTANFLNFMPWQASVDLILRVGISAIEQHNRTLVLKLLNEIDDSQYAILSPLGEDRMSSIVVLSRRERERNSEIHALLAKSGIDVALRAGNLRLSVHLYNTSDEIERVISVLNAAG